jgi:hypothetical protein
MADAQVAPVTPAVDAKAPAVPVKTGAEATRDITVNGKKIAVTDAQLTALAQKGYFADQKLKSMEVLAKNSQGLINALKTPEGLLNVLKDPSLGNSPKAVLKALLKSDAIDEETKEDISKWVYDNVVQTAKMTPEELEKSKKLSDYERLKKQEDERKEKDINEQQKAKINQIYSAVRAEVTKQILADKTFPQTEGSIRAVVEKIRVMNKQKIPVTVESIGKAIQLVKKDHLLHQQSMFDALEDPEQLIALFGEDRALKISKALVARLRKKEKESGKVETRENGPRKKVTDEADERFGRTAGGYTLKKL